MTDKQTYNTFTPVCIRVIATIKAASAHVPGTPQGRNKFTTDFERNQPNMVATLHVHTDVSSRLQNDKL